MKEAKVIRKIEKATESVNLLLKKKEAMINKYDMAIRSGMSVLNGWKEELELMRIKNDQCIGCGKFIDTAHSPEGGHVCSDCYHSGGSQ